MEVSVLFGFWVRDGATIRKASQVPHPKVFQDSWANQSTRRKRKSLFNRIEIDLSSGKAGESGITLVPLSLLFSVGEAKVEVALARGKKAMTSGKPQKKLRTRFELPGRFRPREESGRHAGRIKTWIAIHPEQADC